ncbi:biotin transporter BioY [Kurthia gibsonii]|uniref:biotin transporter BioY n=1 Tax=Kurthia gibsonii TaxID=33946 RepID=UPI0031B6FD76
MRNEQLKMWILSALFAAIIGIFAQVTIPLPLIPITGQTFAIGLAVTILGLRYGSLSVFIYILLGAIGIPVFSGMSGGLGVVAGPTGGYIIGFLPAAVAIGLYLEKFGFTKVQAIIANIIGMIVTLAFGTIWLKFSADLSWTGAFMGGVYPFLLVGVIKAILSALAGVAVRNRLLHAQLLRVQH